ncbi:hypothetical protein A1351_07075 [Methylosinus sp. R-45379]|uniref:hypothetical protein n=1 Tax=unclassified Methylosinus TaxID=2624500 RepID=UPI0004631187|nr:MULTISPECIES: hypothetical protein [unclassified Methylosinus]OAI31037.1 hypothetical protein A1351_07075 [Methylosinus sp. R-45379]TDX63458.1 short chain amide porin [Methylosinus sp. sav-2]
MNQSHEALAAQETTRRRSKLAAKAAPALALAVCCLIGDQAAQARVVVPFGDDQWVSVGFGLRPFFSDVTRNHTPGTNPDRVDLESFRIFSSASFNQYLKATFNTEVSSNNTIQVLDGYGQFEPLDEINVWGGRMLPPSDRANLDGPYYLLGWSYPGVVSRYPGKVSGRMDGGTVWGKLFEKRLTYSFGVYDGHNQIIGASNQSGNPLFAGRLNLNLLDPDPDPAYYTSSTYFGGADVLAIGVAAQYQQDGVGNQLQRADFTAWNVDVLFEKKLGEFGAATFEGAYYRYYTHGVNDVATNFNNARSTDLVGGIRPGEAYMVGAGYLIPYVIGWGRFQPYFRYQSFRDTLAATWERQYDMGVSYVIDGHNLRITANYAINQFTARKDIDKFILGVQIQF